MKGILERFLEYVKIDTESVDGADKVPSSQGQFELAHKLAKELEEMGLEKIKVDEHACVTALLRGNIEGKKVPAIGFLAHLDTSPDCSGHDVKPQVHENYAGGEIVINKEKNVVISPETNKILECYVGNTIVTSDGTTLLGADNKAGISIIMEAAKYLIEHPEIKHGDMCIGFTPDEEVQGGAELFDIENFGADFAFTVDGDAVGEFNHETFNAAGATVNIKGVCIHPGSAKNKLVNPLMLATEFLAALPKDELPETTEGREGFFYPYEMKGNETEATIEFLLRDFEHDSMDRRKEMLNKIASDINERWGSDYVSVEISDQYSNMNDVLAEHPHIIETAIEAYKACGIVKPQIVAIRGGTDGSTLSRRGLPTPNIFVGGHNFHSASEFVSVEGMEKARDIVVKILELYGSK